jgi:hypothetical protein
MRASVKRVIDKSGFYIIPQRLFQDLLDYSYYATKKLDFGRFGKKF